jgi:hypothetical protein
LGHPAVDEELDARDVATLVGSKERDYLGNFVQSSRATNGYFAHYTVCVLFDLFFRHARGIAVAREGITPGLTRGFAVFEIGGEGAREFSGREIYLDLKNPYLSVLHPLSS